MILLFLTVWDDWTEWNGVLASRKNAVLRGQQSFGFNTLFFIIEIDAISVFQSSLSTTEKWIKADWGSTVNFSHHAAFFEIEMVGDVLSP